jgi:hypothetical protein
MSSLPPDPQAALAAARRELARAPGQLADGLVRAARSLSDDRLAQLMQTPARRVVLDGIFWQLPRQIDRTRASELTAAIRWRISGRPDGRADLYQLEIAGGRSRVMRRPTADDPHITITLDATELLRLATGSTHPIKSYLDGRVAFAGNPVLAAKLIALLRLPRRDAAAREPGSADPA